MKRLPFLLACVLLLTGCGAPPEPVAAPEPVPVFSNPIDGFFDCLDVWGPDDPGREAWRALAWREEADHALTVLADGLLPEAQGKVHELGAWFTLFAQSQALAEAYWRSPYVLDEAQRDRRLSELCRDMALALEGVEDVSFDPAVWAGRLAAETRVTCGVPAYRVEAPKEAAQAEGNPVDDWFGRLDLDACTEQELGAVMEIWADAWQTEVDQGYWMLRSRSPLDREAELSWKAAEGAFQGFAVAWGEAWAIRTMNAEDWVRPDGCCSGADRLGQEGRRDACRGLALRLRELAGTETYAFRSAPCARRLQLQGIMEVPVFSNPIDGFFETASFQNGGTILEGSMRAALYAGAWEDELNHVYDGLERDASPALTEYVADVAQVRADFLDFAAAQAEVEGYLRCSDAFGDDGGGYGEKILRGRLFNEDVEYARADLLRTHVLELYSMMVYPNLMENPPAFAFDPQTVMDRLEGAPVTPGAYAVDPFFIEGPRPEYDNPIDRYFEEHPLSSGGTTVMMGATWAIRRDIWQAELEHAYDQLLARAHPTDPAPREALEEARDAFLRFAPNYGDVNAYFLFSNAFAASTRETDEWAELDRGTGIGPQSVWAAADLYRRQTIRLWERMEEIGVEPEFAFDPADWSERMDGWMEGDIA